MEVDPIKTSLIRIPTSVSIIEKNARVMRWLMTCQNKNKKQIAPQKAPLRSLSGGDFSATHSPPLSPAVPTSQQSKKLLTTYPLTSVPTTTNGYSNISAGLPTQGRYNLRRKVQTQDGYPSSPPPIPPRTYQRQVGFQNSLTEPVLVGTPKESNV